MGRTPFPVKAPGTGGDTSANASHRTLGRHCCVRRRRRETVEAISLGSALSSPRAGYRFPREVIAVAVRWYLRYGLSYGDFEELLAGRGIEVDHVAIYRWVQTFTPEFIDAA
jgi:hypothetical protein